jgi:hypothetical protein
MWWQPQGLPGKRNRPYLYQAPDLGFQFATDHQQLNELQVTHYLDTITAAALVPLALHTACPYRTLTCCGGVFQRLRVGHGTPWCCSYNPSRSCERLLLGIPLGSRKGFAYRGITFCADDFHASSATNAISYSLPDQQLRPSGPATPITQRLLAVTRNRFGLFPFRSPLLRTAS